MNKKEAAQLLAILKAAYPNHYKMGAEEAVGVVGVWAMQFKDMPADIVAMAVNKHIAKNTFPPSIAEIKEQIHSLHFEAYAIMATRLRWESLTKEQQENVDRIYKITERYNSSKGFAVPTLETMICGGNMPLLTGGNE